MEAHASQDIVLVLMNKEQSYYVAMDGRPCAAVIGMKDCLAEGGMIDSDPDTNNYNNCQRRAWCNNEFMNALPPTFKSIVKLVNVYESDYALLPSENEIEGQLEYYETPANRKKGGYTSDGYFLRNIYNQGCHYVRKDGTISGGTYMPTKVAGICTHMGI